MLYRGLQASADRFRFPSRPRAETRRVESYRKRLRLPPRYAIMKARKNAPIKRRQEVYQPCNTVTLTTRPANM